ncbi:MAG: Lrp/AsnC family transcriptional regulator [Holophagales bacterium]|nr:MAG: Lrp/AsnC family transcriptional regulator [Holophagales bacterium]
MASETTKPPDEISWRILRELQLDGRVSFTELGRRVGLSTPAVAERVRNLEAAGVIRGYRAEIDLAKVGLPMLAVVRMSAVGDVLTRMTQLSRELPEVLECHRATGADSFIMKVAVSSVEHLERLIDRLTPFGTTSTSIVLSSPVTGRIVEAPIAEGGARKPAAARPVTRAPRSAR